MASFNRKASDPEGFFGRDPSGKDRGSFTKDPRRILQEGFFRKDIHEGSFTKDLSRRIFHKGSFTKDLSQRIFHEGSFTKDLSQRIFQEVSFRKDLAGRVYREGSFMNDLSERIFPKASSLGRILICKDDLAAYPFLAPFCQYNKGEWAFICIEVSMPGRQLSPHKMMIRRNFTAWILFTNTLICRIRWLYISSVRRSLLLCIRCKRVRGPLVIWK